MGDEVNQQIQDPTETGVGGLSAMNKYSTDAQMNLSRQTMDAMRGLQYDDGSFGTVKQFNQAFRGFDDINQHYDVGNIGGLGESSFDEDMTTLGQLEKLEDSRALLQPTIAKWGAGFGKMLGITATTFLDQTIGTIWGLGSIGYSFITGDGRGFSAFYDNDMSNYLRSVEEEMEKVMPNYRTELEKTNAWYQNLGTANFWADTIMKNAGFTIGTALATAATMGVSSALTGGRLAIGTETGLMSRGLGAAARGATRASSAVGAALGEATSAVGGEAKLAARGFRIMGQPLERVVTEQGVTELRNYSVGTKLGVSVASALGETHSTASINLNQWIQNSVQNRNLSATDRIQNLDKWRDAKYLQIDEGTDMDEPDNEAYNTATKEEKKRMIDAKHQEEVNKILAEREQGIAEDAARAKVAANANFIADMVLLTATNMAGTFSNFRAKLPGSEREIMVTTTMGKKLHDFKQFVAHPFNRSARQVYDGIAYKATGRFREGLKQATAEGLVEEGGQGVTSSAAYEYGYRYDEDERKEFGSYLGLIWDEAKKQYGDLRNYDEIFAGAVTGVLGVPFPHKIKDRNGNAHWSFWQGGIFSNEVKEQIAESEDVARKMNDTFRRLRDEGTATYVIGQRALDNLRTAYENGYDDEGYDETIAYKQLVDDVVYFALAGRTKDLMSLAGNPKLKVSKEEIDNLIKATDGVKSEGSEILVNRLGLRDESGNLKTLTKDDYDEIGKKIQERREQIAETIKDVRNVMAYVENKSNNYFSKEELKEVIWPFLAANHLRRNLAENYALAEKNPVVKMIEDRMLQYRNELEKYFNVKENEDGTRTIDIRNPKVPMDIKTKRQVRNLQRKYGFGSMLIEQLRGSARKSAEAGDVGATLDLANWGEKTDIPYNHKETLGEAFTEWLRDEFEDDYDKVIKNQFGDDSTVLDCLNDFVDYMNKSNVATKLMNDYKEKWNEYMEREDGKLKLREWVNFNREKIQKRDLDGLAHRTKEKLLANRKAYEEGMKALNEEIAARMGQVDSSRITAAQKAVEKEFLEGERRSRKRQLEDEYRKGVASSFDEARGYGMGENQNNITMADRMTDRMFDDPDVGPNLQEMEELDALSNTMIALVKNHEGMSDAQKAVAIAMIQNDRAFYHNADEYRNESLTKDIRRWVREGSPLAINRNLDGTVSLEETQLGNYINNLLEGIDINGDLEAFKKQNFQYFADMVLGFGADNRFIEVGEDGKWKLTKQGTDLINAEAKRMLILNAMDSYNEFKERALDAIAENGFWGKEIFMKSEIKDLIDEINMFDVWNNWKTEPNNASETDSPSTEYIESVDLESEITPVRNSEGEIVDFEGNVITRGRIMFNELGALALHVNNNLESAKEDGKVSFHFVETARLLDTFISLDDFAARPLLKQLMDEHRNATVDDVDYLFVRALAKSLRDKNSALAKMLEYYGGQQVKLPYEIKATFAGIANAVMGFDRFWRTAVGSLEDAASSNMYFSEDSERSDKEISEGIFVLTNLIKNYDGNSTATKHLIEARKGFITDISNEELRNRFLKAEADNNIEDLQDNVESLFTSGAMRKLATDAVLNSENKDMGTAQKFAKPKVGEEMTDEEQAELAADTQAKAAENFITEQVNSMQPQTSQYNINSLITNKEKNAEPMRYSEGVFYGDKNIDHDPKEVEAYLDKCGAFDFINSGELANWMESNENGDVYILTDEELNGTIPSSNGEKKNVKYSVKHDGTWIPCYFAYENATFFKDKYGDINVRFNGKPKLAKSDDGKNIPLANAQTVKFESNGKVEDVSPSVIMDSFIVSSQPNKFFAIKNGVDSNGKPKFQVLGLVPKVSGDYLSNGANASKYYSVGMNIQLLSDIMFNRFENSFSVSTTGQNKYSKYMYGLPTRMSGRGNYPHLGGRRVSNGSPFGCTNILDAYQTEAFLYYSKMSEDEQKGNKISVEKIDDKHVRVKKDGKTYVYEDKRTGKYKGEGYNVHMFFATAEQDKLVGKEFTEEGKPSALFTLADTVRAYQAATGKTMNDNERAEFEKGRKETLKEIAEFADSMLEENGEDYIESGNIVDGGSSIKAFKLKGQTVNYVSSAIFTYKKGENTPLSLGNERKYNGNTTTLGEMIDTGVASIGVVATDSQGKKNIVDAEGRHDYDGEMNSGTVILSMPNANGKQYRVPLVVSKYSVDKFGNDETMNASFESAADSLLQIEKGQAIDSNSSDNPLFSAMNRINEAVHIPINQDIYVGRNEATGAKEYVRIHIKYNSSNDSIELYSTDGKEVFNKHSVPIDRRDDGKQYIVDGLKKAVASFDRPININLNAMSKDNAKEYINKGFLQTNLTSLEPVNAYFRVGAKNQNSGSVEFEHDNKIYKSFRETLSAISSASEKLTVDDNIITVQMGNIPMRFTIGTDIYGNQYITDEDGMRIGDDIKESLSRRFGLIEKGKHGRERSVGNILNVIKRIMYTQANSKVYGTRAFDKDHPRIHNGIYCFTFNSGPTIYFDSVTNKPVSESEWEDNAMNEEGQPVVPDGSAAVENTPTPQEEQKPIQEEPKSIQQENPVEQQEETADEGNVELTEDDVDEQLANAFEDLNREETEEYEKADLEDETRWLASVLPQFTLGERTFIVDHLDVVGKKGAKAWGKMQDACIYLANDASRGTAYHEAYHAVSMLMLSPNERQDMYSEYRKYKKNDSLSNKECEEGLAEMFRHYVQARELGNRHGMDKVFAWFKSLYHKIRLMIEYPSAARALFRRINRGEFANRKVESKNKAASNEIEEIKSKSIANGTFMKAPNGKPTNLNEKQWLQVRTKSFKDWFGDWESVNRFNTKALDLSKVDIEEVDKPWRDDPNRKNKTLRIYIKGQHNKGYFELVKDEEFGYFSVHFKTSKEGAKYNAENTEYTTKEERKTLFEELVKAIPNGALVSTWGSLSEDGVRGLDNVGRDMTKVGKRGVMLKSNGGKINIPIYQKGKGVSKAVDKNGEPLVVFHGSKAIGIAEFKKELLGKNTGAKSAEMGFFFSNLKNNSRVYADTRGSDFIFATKEANREVVEVAVPLINEYTKDVNDFMAKLGKDGDSNSAVRKRLLDFAIDENDTIDKIKYVGNEIDLNDGVKLLSLHNRLKFKKVFNEFVARHNEITRLLDGIKRSKETNRYGQEEIDKVNVGSYFLNIRNPHTYDFDKRSNTEDAYISSEIQKGLDSGNDGTILYNVNDPIKSDDYIVFEPNQIKSATDNVGTFSTEDNDIRYREAVEQDMTSMFDVYEQNNMASIGSEADYMEHIEKSTANSSMRGIAYTTGYKEDGRVLVAQTSKGSFNSVTFNTFSKSVGHGTAIVVGDDLCNRECYPCIVSSYEQPQIPSNDRFDNVRYVMTNGDVIRLGSTKDKERFASYMQSVESQRFSNTTLDDSKLNDANLTKDTLNDMSAIVREKIGECL